MLNHTCSHPHLPTLTPAQSSRRCCAPRSAPPGRRAAAVQAAAAAVRRRQSRARRPADGPRLSPRQLGRRRDRLGRRHHQRRRSATRSSARSVPASSSSCTTVPSTRRPGRPSRPRCPRSSAWHAGRATASASSTWPHAPIRRGHQRGTNASGQSDNRGDLIDAPRERAVRGGTRRSRRGLRRLVCAQGVTGGTPPLVPGRSSRRRRGRGRAGADAGAWCPPAACSALAVVARELRLELVTLRVEDARAAS